MDEQDRNQENLTDSENFEREEQNDVHQDHQESQKEDASFSSEKVEAADAEKETSSEEKENFETEVSVTEPTETQFSCSYEPPYNTPIFSSAHSAEMPEKGKKKKSLIIGLMILGAAILFVGGALVGYFLLDSNGSSKFPNGAGAQLEEKKVYSSFAEVVDVVAASVVEIDSVDSSNQILSGSGVIIDAKGYIITNQHVLEDFSKIFVRLRNGKEYVAQYVGGDSKYDVAVLKIVPEEESALVVATIGKSSDVRVGEEVLAIGNPLGKLGGTVTNGIVSAKNRKIRTDFYPMTFLQTNAQISQGNSGGALFNMSGELIGIVNAKVIDTEAGAEGLGFAIPIDVAWRCAKDLMSFGYVTGEPDLGISISEEKPGIGYENGIYINATQNDQLKVNDRILKINGTTVSSMEDIYRVTDEMKIGDTIELTVSRRGASSLIVVSITVTEYKP